MCSNPFLYIREYQYLLTCYFLFFPFFCTCKAIVPNQSPGLSSTLLNKAPVSGCRHSSCVLILHFCLCVYASVCAYENVWVRC